MGDINSDYLKDNDHREIKNLFFSYGYKQLIEKATRITETSETLIDVTLTNSPETIRNYDEILSSNGDRDIIAIIRKKLTPKYSTRTIYSRNYKNYNTNVIKNELRNVNWERVTNCRDSNICWQYIKDILLKCADTHAPLTKKTIKGKPCPWLTEEIKKQMNDRDGLLRNAKRSKNHNDWIRYKNFKNKVNNAIKRAKSKYHKNLLDKNISDPEVFWKHIKTLFPTKMKQTCSKSLIINDIVTTNEREVSNGFCSFFHNAINNLKDFIWSKPKVLPIKTASRFHFRFVSVPEVKRLLKQTDSKKSDRPDLIPACLIKDCTHELAPSITLLLNVILEASTILNDFKIDRILAIYKSGEKNQLNNYRPITVLPILLKIMEKCIDKQLTVYLENNNLLSSRQFGFRKGKLTELAATLFFDDVHRVTGRGELTGSIFIDKSQCFAQQAFSIWYL